MSKFSPLWAEIQRLEKNPLTLTFAQIGEICGVAIDHSFLQAKSELIAYGYTVKKINLKAETVLFEAVLPPEGKRD